MEPSTPTGARARLPDPLGLTGVRSKRLTGWDACDVLEAVALVCPARRVGAWLGEAAEEYPCVGGPDESLGYGGSRS